MLFNSYFFILIFLPITLIGYYAFKKNAKYWLLFCSLFFYGHWNPKYLVLISLSIIVNLLISNHLIKNKKRWVFLLGLSFNLGLLGYFKYFNFFVENISSLSGSSLTFEKIILPLGISFFTLQQIAFVVDSYQGMIKEKKGWLEYSVFVSFFPQLIAGPIVHYTEVMPQFKKKTSAVFNSKNFSLGLYVFVIGLFKKVMIADFFAVFATRGFEGVESLHLLSAWGTSLSYTMQLYFDFSGYSDMAIGLGLLFNIMLPINFNSPLKSKNIIEFWSKWHITLTNFITAYIYTPLVRAMPKMSFSYFMFASFVTMTIAGLWHGAAWTFVVYGMLHGLAIIVNHLWKKTKIILPAWLSWLLAFNFLNICFAMFRASSFNQFIHLLKAMTNFENIKFPKGMIGKETLNNWGIETTPFLSGEENAILLLFLICFLVILKAPNTKELMDRFDYSNKKAVFSGAMFVLCLFGLNRLTEFIYFNF